MYTLVIFPFLMEKMALHIFGLATLALLPTFFYRLAHVHFFTVIFSLPMNSFSIFSQSTQKILKKRRLASLSLLSTLFLHPLHYDGFFFVFFLPLENFQNFFEKYKKWLFIGRAVFIYIYKNVKCVCVYKLYLLRVQNKWSL